MDIREIEPRDEVVTWRHWEIGRAADGASRPYDFSIPWPTVRRTYVEGREDADIVLLGAFEGDVMWGAARIDLSTYDNLHMASCAVHTHPERQRRGIGRALAQAALGTARDRGRRMMHTEAFAPVGGTSPGVQFAERMGFRRALEEGMKVVDLPATEDRWDELAAEAARFHDGYRLVTWGDRVPDEHVEAYCRLCEIFMAEAPTGDLDVQAERWDEERLRKRERRNARSGRHQAAAGALAPDGTLIAFTEAAVNEHAAGRGFQSGTLVCPEHRGHRLGIAVKVANHRQIRQRFPDCRLLITGNADVNAPMNAVNEALGYREVERCIEMQRDV